MSTRAISAGELRGATPGDLIDLEAQFTPIQRDFDVVARADAGYLIEDTAYDIRALQIAFEEAYGLDGLMNDITVRSALRGLIAGLENNLLQKITSSGLHDLVESYERISDPSTTHRDETNMWDELDTNAVVPTIEQQIAAVNEVVDMQLNR